MKKIIALLMMVGSPVWLFAQKDIAKYFPAAAVTTGGASNVQQLVSGYLTPIAQDFGSLSSGGWYTTAATHSRFGFDLNVTMNAISASSDAKSFNPGSLNLQGIQYNGSTSGSGQSPTVYGSQTTFPLFNYTGTPGPLSNSPLPFVGPAGGNVSADVPVGSLVVPTIQGGIGLFGNTDVRFRYTPAVTISGTQLNNWGLGFMHDIKQHIPGIKMAPFSLSLLLAYTQLTAKTNLSGYYAGTGQEGVGDTKAYTFQVLVSKKIAIVTFYGGIGYNKSTTSYAINGTYNVNFAVITPSVPATPLTPFIPEVTAPLIAPVTLTAPFKQEFNSNGVRFTGGIRFNLGPIILNGDYTFVNKQGLYTMGFGFTVR